MLWGILNKGELMDPITAMTLATMAIRLGTSIYKSLADSDDTPEEIKKKIAALLPLLDYMAAQVEAVEIKDV